MKLKYYLRGFASGILLTTIIFMIASLGDKSNLTNTEIIKRAEALGMVKKEETLFDTSNQTSTEESITESCLQQENSGEEKESTSEQPSQPTAQAEEAKKEDSKDQLETSSESVTYQEAEDSKSSNSQTDKADMGSTTNENPTNNKSSNSETITFTIQNGMSAPKVAKMLQEKGIIKDKDSFYQYLVKHGYATSILSGEYTVPKNISNEELAKLIIEAN